MKKLLLIMFLFALKSNAQYMKIYVNGGCIMMVDSANTIKSCDSDFRFQTNESTSTVTISTDTRKFANYRYTQVKKADGTNLASSFSDLLTKLGEIQGGISGGITSISAINNSFSCESITSVKTLTSNTYKEISVTPVESGVYTFRTGTDTPIAGIKDYALIKSDTGLISTTITVTPTGGSIIIVCTKQ